MDPTFISIFSGAAGGVLSKAFDGPLKSLEDIWYSSIGYKSDRLRQIAELKNHDAIEKYKNGITEEISKIPQNNLHEPNLAIAGPALEASTYYVTDETVRNMFEKLIASSMDFRKDDIAHVSFVEIVKQMSPLDATFLKEFSKHSSIPIGELRSSTKSGENGYIVKRTNVVLNNFKINPEYRNQLPSTMDNLQRLGIVNIDYAKWNANVDYDKDFCDTPEYIEVKSEIEKENEKDKELLSLGEDQLIKFTSKKNIELLRKSYPNKIKVGAGRLDITAFGNNFVSVCL